MIKETIKVNKENGLEPKQAALFIQKASNYKSNVWIEKGERKANGKSLLGILSLEVAKDSDVTIIAEGEDEEEVLKVLKDFLTSDLEESV
ncbi:HPr family phosphocarrier protein [Acetivibrio saccincola]|jgi:phosphotransferase system HPr (HPr) family protein|uniref:HPr family phosphocarrier protein n=1 Tax=Acetivibrio saccincola TaxID=1677857 RepID=A0A2K9EEB6_9FIRM|nr:HPr family phosphocarrier protein [Acetivibrio saccincola]AUG58494.1 HPr-like protein Crh [Acetivibrio saccincola]NLW27224.1 HPr family phosphocarrier protein [Acetivibrio saccincola]PQQ66305.1 HPr family phosphocarrier protein [Acetivibrio saccincola]HQD28637.1 HPr family phosphocarrier protein [Acetivibrio saccincola]